VNVPWTNIPPKASKETTGGFKTGFPTADKNYAVTLNGEGQAYVNVPWTINALIPRPSSRFWIG